MASKTDRIAFIIFNNLNSYGENPLFFGDMHVSLYSGLLSKTGIDNDILLVFFYPGGKRRNIQAVKQLIKYLKEKDYKFIFLRSQWSSWVVKNIEDATGRKIRFLNSEVGMQKLDSISGIKLSQADFKKRFYPNLRYIFFGVNKAPIQTAAALFTEEKCRYSKTITGNYFYKDVFSDRHNQWRGCSYCFSSLSDTGVSGSRKIKINTIKEQISYLKSRFPYLKLFLLPFIENYFDVLPDVLEDKNIEPLSLYINLRPDILVQKRDKLEKILRVMHKKKSSFLVSNIGFENFSLKELKILNRGYDPAVNFEALKVFRFFQHRYPDNWLTQWSNASFIIFEPLTTVSDILINIRAMRNLKNAFNSFAGINFHKLRVIKNTPIFYLAKQARLIFDQPCAADFSNLPHDGYAGEGIEYHFRDRQVDSVYKCYRKLLLSNRIFKSKFYLLDSLINSLDHASNPRSA